jgi:hypothetical protein
MTRFTEKFNNKSYVIYGSGPVAASFSSIPANSGSIGINNTCMIYDTDIGIYKEKPIHEWLKKLQLYKGRVFISEYSHGMIDGNKNQWAPKNLKYTLFHHYHNRSEGFLYEYIDGIFPSRPLLVGASTAISAIDLAISFGANDIYLVGASGKVVDDQFVIDGYNNPESDTVHYKLWLEIYREQLHDIIQSFSVKYNINFHIID